MKVILIFFYFIITLYAKGTELKLEHIKLQLQWKHQFEFAGFYAAKEKGFYKENGLDVDFIEFNPEMNIIDEVLNNKADYGITSSSLLVDYIKGKPIVLIANFLKYSPLVLAMQKDINNPFDLKNNSKIGIVDFNQINIVLSMLDKFDIKKKNIEIIQKDFSLDDFINKKLDAIAVFNTNGIYKLNQKGISYNTFNLANFGINNYDLNLFTTKEESVNNSKRLEKFKQASIKGWEYALNHKEELIDIIIEKYNTQNKSREALSFEANQIESFMLRNLYPIGSIDLEKLQSISNNFSESLSIKKISKQKLKSFVYRNNTNFINLNLKEEEYLKNKKILNICVNPNWMPLERIKDGVHIGIAAEFINLISQRIKTHIQLIKTRNTKESLEKLKNRECDLMPLTEENSFKKKFLNFTSSYISVPLVLVTKDDVPFIDNLSNIKQKTVGIVSDYSSENKLKDKYPKINFISVSSVEEGISLVNRDKIFGFLDNSMAISNDIKKNGKRNVAITGQSLQSYHFRIASRNDEILLNRILEKALLSIDDKTRDLFIQKWNNINYQIKVDYEIIFKTLFFGIVLISISIYWNLKLKEEIKNKEIVQGKLKDSEEKFRTLFDQAPILLNSFDEEGRIALWNKECEKVFGWTFEEISRKNDPLKLFYPDPLIQKRILFDFKNNQGIYRKWEAITKNGKLIVVKWASIKLHNNEIIHIGYDVTNETHTKKVIQDKAHQLKIAKEQLLKLNLSLEKRVKKEIEKNTEQQIILMHQSKLVQMGEMIANIAHQWRQPLAQVNSLVLLIDILMQKNDFRNSEVEKQLNEIESLTSYMSKTIDDFKNFFNPNKTKSTFKIEDAIYKGKDIVGGLIRFHHIKVDLDIQDNLECFTYLEELQQVILIIINNSIDALSLVNISHPKIYICGYEEGNYVVIRIEDNALGIKEEYLDKIFEPYFTTKHKTQGTGLGLYMAKMIIENGLLGSLKAKNNKNGACFTIKIPKEKE